MPVIRISDATFADLKAVATWIGTETPSQTIDRIVAEMMDKLDLERDLEEGAVAQTVGGSDALEFEKTPGLTFTKIISASIAGKAIAKPNWVGLLTTMVGAVKAKGVSGEKLVAELQVPSRADKFEEQGFTYYPNLGVSIQGQSAADAWKEVSRLAEKWHVPVVVEVQWRHNPKAQYPGKTGILRAHSPKS